MKKHLLGILILVTTFITGFLSSPVRFTSFAVGSGLKGGFTSYSSTYFEKVYCEREPYETREEVETAFEERVKLYSEYVNDQKILELKENRAVITFQLNYPVNYPVQGYCIIRKTDAIIYDICSTSLWHAVEFEKQKFREN